ncbi:TPM domain-containing protein [Candidatus Riflebacteria bacterium]
MVRFHFFRMLLFFLLFFNHSLLLNADEKGNETGKKKIYVDDKAEIISSYFEDKLSLEAAKFEKNADIRIHFITRFFNTLDNFTEYGENYFIPWLNGLKNGKKGLLIFIALKNDSTDGKINIRVGMGLKGLLSEKELQSVINLIFKKNLADQDGEGLYDSFLLLQKILLRNLTNQDNLHSRDQQNPAKAWGISIQASTFYTLLGFIILGFFAYIFLVGEKCPRCSHRLQVTVEKVRKETETHHGITKKILRCHNCGFIRRKKEVLYSRSNPLNLSILDSKVSNELDSTKE